VSTGAEERTELAWRRSGLALAGCGLAMIRGIGSAGAPHHPLAGGFVIALGVVVWGLFVWAGRRRGAATAAPPLSDLAAIAVATAFIGAACLVVALVA
jgi:hypothetical protein